MTKILFKYSANDLAPPQGAKCHTMSNLYGHGGNRGHLYKFILPLPLEAQHKIGFDKIGFDWQKCFREDV